MSSKMSLKRPSYRLRIVFFVLMYSGHFFLMAYWKHAWAKPVID